MAGEVFISYRRSDLAHAKRLHELLKGEGVDAWYDAQVGAGQDWRAATATALSGSKIFVLLFSSAASRSDDIAKELAAATFSKKLIVPVRIENIQPEGPFLYELASRNWIDAYEETDARLKDLARTLAQAVRDGATEASVIPFDRSARSSAPARTVRPRAWMIAAGLVLAGIASGGVYAVLNGDANHTVPGRIAFFGVDAPAGDTDLEAAAAATSTAILSTFGALQRDIAASADTEGVPASERIDSALTLRAQYAVSGAATRVADKVYLSIRVEDAPSRTSLWIESFDGQAANPTAIASRAAALLNDRMTCVINARNSLGTRNMRVVTRLPRACEGIRFSTPGYVERWADLVALAPDSAWLLANESMALLNAIHDALPTAVDDLKRRALDSLQRAEKIDPDEPEVLLARIRVALYNGASLAAAEQMYLDALARSPRASNLYGNYAAFLGAMGRHKDAVSYGRQALATDPLSPPKQLGLAETLLRAGFPGQAEPYFVMRHAQFPDDNEWLTHITAALFGGVGDVDAILRDPPPSSSPQTVACVSDIVRLSRLATPESRREAARRTTDCTAMGAMPPARIAALRVLLGDFDPVFSTAGFEPLRMLSEPEPGLAALRADPRFLAIAESRGLVAYWRETGRHPDFCATESAPVCAAIDAN